MQNYFGLRPFLLTLSLVCGFLLSTVKAQEIKSPEEFIHTDYRQSFTPYLEYVDYLKYLDGASDRAQLVEYGRTYEKRPLHLLLISSKDNLDRLEQLRERHLAGIGMSDMTHEVPDLPVIWISYGVHGNEAGASESALTVLHQLLTDEEWAESLKNGIVIIDPVVNPDGYERYTQWNREVSNKDADIDPETYEHLEPWPGGRLNHYQFDLNRDWAWATQIETQQRLRHYGKWVPHVHVDVHEMFYNDHYYFAPAAEPYHPHITPWQIQYQQMVGSANADTFDWQGWSYFTEEVFDLFYPSYGDTYPMFNGAIGMTYEQGGHSKAGRAILRDNGDTLRIADRIDHHTATSLNTIRVSIENGKELIEQQKQYFNQKLSGAFNSYVIAPEASGLKYLLQKLDLHGIRYGLLEQDRSVKKAYSYKSFQRENVELKKGSVVINRAQPRAVLLDVLLSPESELTDSLTYDITAWSLLHSIGGDAYAVEESLNSIPYIVNDTEQLTQDDRVIAYAFKGERLDDYVSVLGLMQKGYTFRYSKKNATFNKREIPVGSLYCLQRDNKQIWTEALKDITDLNDQYVIPIYSGLADKGSDLGSDQYVRIERPRVGLFTGDGTDPNANGHVWHYFERALNYPVSRLQLNAMNDDLDRFNTLILAHGSYRSVTDEQVQHLTRWIDAGGKLIAEGDALSLVHRADSTILKSKSTGNGREKNFPSRYAQRDRSWLSSHNPGVVLRVKNDDSHPVSACLGEAYPALALGTSTYEWLESGANLSYTTDELNYHGYLGSQLVDQWKSSTLLGIAQKERGSVVVFAHRPLFRGFWYSGQLMFASALLKG